MRILLILMIIGGVLLPLSPAQAQGDEVSWLLNQINSLRASVGLPGYSLNSALSSAAQAHSQWMATSGFISHTELDGSTPESRAAAHGYTGSWVSENIYGGTNGTAAIAWNFWINSPVHYAGLTNSNKNEVGIGVYNGYYTLLFGSGNGVVAPPAPALQPQVPVEAAQPPVESSGAIAQPAAAPAATQAPPRPTRPAITYTPSPTIPTMTPTLTWTPTFTWTPSPTATEPGPTSTPIILPTAHVLQLSALVPTFTTVPLEVAAAIEETPVALPALEQAQVVSEVIDAPNSNGVSPWRILLPILVITQVILLGAAIWWMFLRK